MTETLSEPLAVNRRATNLQELHAVQSRMFGPARVPESIARWKPRPSDVVIAPFSKCGTTWLQQTFNTLRTGGDMDFEDISQAVPWIEMALLCEQDIEAPQRAEPRGFKSHLAATALPAGSKAVVALRDPGDALVSLFHFFQGWFFEPGTISFEDFAGVRLKGGGGPDYWSHLLSWWARRDDPTVLLFSYEGMVADPEGTIRRLAAFCEIPLDDALLALTLERSSRAFMLAHQDQFDDGPMRRASERYAGLPPGSEAAKVRAKGDGASVMTPGVQAALDAIWRERVTPVTGFGGYGELVGVMG